MRNRRRFDQLGGPGIVAELRNNSRGGLASLVADASSTFVAYKTALGIAASALVESPTVSRSFQKQKVEALRVCESPGRLNALPDDAD